MRVQKHLFIDNSARKKARDKSKIPNERVDQAGHFGGLVTEIRPKMTEILMVHQKTQKELTFPTFFWITPKLLAISTRNQWKIHNNFRKKKIENEISFFRNSKFG